MWHSLCNPLLFPFEVSSSAFSAIPIFVRSVINAPAASFGFEMIQVPPVFLDVHLDHFLLDSKQLLVQKCVRHQV
ncbi:hypothetical protein RIF29_33609 [Crotalaria pallida]|uniref:Uncharacterized protein n=1 Tax=Crotalaria pallida TaxID=3830 RepID=A0AAN9EDU3_CROPI